MSLAFAPGWRAEGATDGDARWKAVRTTPRLEEMFWYRNEFLDREASHYTSHTEASGTLVVSLVMQPQLERCVCLVRSEKGGLERYDVPLGNIVTSSWLRWMCAMGPTVNDVLRFCAPPLADVALQAAAVPPPPQLDQQLLEFEDPDGHQRRFAVGLVYCGRDQRLEQDILGNREGSARFERFLGVVGERVQLHGFGGYAAGLDVRNSAHTGDQSLYSRWSDYEIMWHVSTMLPYSRINPQQLDRKRHIGNDRIVVVFMDGDHPYDPSTIRSKLTQVVIVVQPVGGGSDDDKAGSTGAAPSLPSTPSSPLSSPSSSVSPAAAAAAASTTSTSASTSPSADRRRYRVAVACKESVPCFQPPLPADGLLDEGPELVDYLFGKITSAFRAAVYGDEFRLVRQLQTQVGIKTVASLIAPAPAATEQR